MEVSAGFLRVFKVYVVAIFFLIIFSGCATKEAVKSLTDEEIVREKAVAYLNYKMKEEFEKAYLMEYPLYREKVSLSKYIRNQSSPAIKYNSAEILGIKKSGDDTMDVKEKINVTLKPFGAKPFTTDHELTERWVKIEGEWYHIPEKKSASQDNNRKGGDVK